MTVTSLGGINGSIGSGGHLNLVVPAGGIPAGRFIYVGVGVNASGIADTFTAGDDAGNTYHATTFISANNVSLKSFYAFNISALSAGQNIWVANSGASRGCNWSGLFADGVQSTSDPFQAATFQSNGGTSANPTVTMAAAPSANSLVIAMVSFNSGTATFTQDSTHAAYSVPPDYTHGGTKLSVGGNVISSSQLTWTPTFSVSAGYVANIMAFTAGTSPLNGSLAATLGALTSSASGTLELSGSVNATLGALTSAAQGALVAPPRRTIHLPAKVILRPSIRPRVQVDR